jgi:dTDP-glucose 4,6-dehydratase
MTVMLVTGGCGFIGSHFIHHVLETDAAIQIVNLDALTYAGNPHNVADLREHPRYRFVQGDIADRECVRDALTGGVEVIVNFAAETHVDRSIDDSSAFVRTNVLGTQVLLDAARTHGVSRFVQISTDEVYGALGRTGAFTEESPLAPSSPYAASKAGADLLVQSYRRTYGLPTVITRSSNNYGPRQYPEKIIPLFITKMLRDEPVPLYGDGRNVRDWIHVRDHCRAIDLVWRRGRVGEIYNIGGGCERSNLELTHALLSLLGKPASLIRPVADRPGHDWRYALDCTKIQSELGWRPEVDFMEGLRETVAYYRADGIDGKKMMASPPPLTPLALL